MSESAVDRHDFWLRALRRWDWAFYGMCAVAALSAVVVPGSWTQRRWALVIIGLLVASYVLVGRPAAVRGSARRADAYIAILVTLTSICVTLVNGGFVLLFVAFSQIWFFVRSRRAGAVWSAVLSATVVLAVAVRLADLRQAWGDVGTQMLAALAFSIAIGLWITEQAEVSEERAVLVDQLRATQDELAVSHHAAGVLAERERMAQEIHDTLAQGFTSVVMLSQTASTLLDRGRLDETADRLVQIEQVARDNLAEARALVAAFGPVALQGATLGEALSRLAGRFEAETGVATRVQVTSPDVPAEVAVALLRTAQEALANVRRHAGARHVELRLAAADGRVELAVDDDGRGLPADVREGFGLAGMRERAAAGGGTLELAGAPGQGTRVRLSLPVAT